MTQTKILTCTCCGAEITAPQFHDGKAYGWTCIRKVAPAAKQSKVKFVPVDVVAESEHMLKIRGEKAYNMKVVFRGATLYIKARVSDRMVQDGVMFVSADVIKEGKTKC